LIVHDRTQCINVPLHQATNQVTVLLLLC